MVFLTVGFWWHCLLATLMQALLKKIDSNMLLCNVDILFLFFTRLSKALTLTRNAPSLEMSPFEAVSSLVSSTLGMNAAVILHQIVPISRSPLLQPYLLLPTILLNVTWPYTYTLNVMTNLMVRLLLSYVTALQMMFYHDGLPNPLGSEDTA